MSYKRIPSIIFFLLLCGTAWTQSPNVQTDFEPFARFSKDGKIKLIREKGWQGIMIRIFKNDLPLVEYLEKEGRLIRMVPGFIAHREHEREHTTMRKVISKYKLHRVPKKMHFEEGITYEIELIETHETRVYGCSRDQVGRICDVYFYENQIFLKRRKIYGKQQYAQCTFYPERLKNRLIKDTQVWLDQRNQQLFLYRAGVILETLDLKQDRIGE